MRGPPPAATSRRVSLHLTLILLAVCAVLAVFTGWRGARPPNFAKGPRMMPWRFLMVLFAALGSLLLIHVVGLLSAGPPA